MARRLVVPALLCTALTGCFDSPEYAFIESDDVRIEAVRGQQYREALEYGDLYAISMQSAHDVGGWIGVVLETTGKVLDVLDRFPGNDSDAEGFEVYGPYSPKDAGVAWLFRLDGDVETSRFEVWVGREGAGSRDDMQRLLAGDVAIDDDSRRGKFTLDFDVYEKYGEGLKSELDRDRHYTGVVDIEFARELGSDYKHIDIGYDNFTVTQDEPISDYFAATRYQFLREADGSGTFNVDIASTFQALLWSGPEVETMTIDMSWDSTGAGRAHGEMRETEKEGDLMLGDLTLDECFDGRGALVWREISDKYAEALPDYNTGDRRRCAQ